MTDQDLNKKEKPYYGKQTSSMAVVSLVLGIASYFVIPLLGAIAAIITGNLARKEIRQNPENLTGEGMAKWGMILGWVNVGLSAIGVCVALFFAVMVVLAALGIATVPFFFMPFSNGGF